MIRHPAVAFFHDSSGYGDNEYCEIEVSQPVRLHVQHFDTESCCDHLTVRAVNEPGNEFSPVAKQKYSPRTVLSEWDTYWGSYSGSQGPNGVLAAEGASLRWRSDGGLTRSGWAICALGARADMSALHHSSDGGFTEPGPAYPWHLFPSAFYFCGATLAFSAIGALAAVLARCQPQQSPSTGACCKGRRVQVLARVLASFSVVGNVMAHAGLIRTSTVACLASAHECVPMLPYFHAGALLTLLAALLSHLLVVALEPPKPVNPTTKLEGRLARWTRFFCILTSLLGLAALVVTCVVHPFNRLPGVYVFAIVQLVAPGFGIAGATLVLRSNYNSGGSKAPSRLAAALLLINAFVVGVVVVGLPVTAAGGYGGAMSLYIVNSVVSCCSAAASLGLFVLLQQWTSANSREESVQLAMSEQLAASERRCEQMETKMEAMLEQQTRMLEILSATPKALVAAVAEQPGGGAASAAQEDPEL